MKLGWLVNDDFKKVFIFMAKLWNNYINPYSGVLLENQISPQLVKKFAFCGTRKIVTAITTTRHLSLLETTSSSQCTPPHFLNIHFYIILPTTPMFTTWSLFPRAFLSNLCIHLSSLNTCYLPRPSHSSWFGRPFSIRCGVQSIKLLIL